MKNKPNWITEIEKENNSIYELFEVEAIEPFYFQPDDLQFIEDKTIGTTSGFFASAIGKNDIQHEYLIREQDNYYFTFNELLASVIMRGLLIEDDRDIDESPRAVKIVPVLLTNNGEMTVHVASKIMENHLNLWDYFLKYKDHLPVNITSSEIADYAITHFTGGEQFIAAMAFIGGPDLNLGNILAEDKEPINTITKAIDLKRTMSFVANCICYLTTGINEKSFEEYRKTHAYEYTSEKPQPQKGIYGGAGSTGLAIKQQPQQGVYAGIGVTPEMHSSSDEQSRAGVYEGAPLAFANLFKDLKALYPGNKTLEPGHPYTPSDALRTMHGGHFMYDRSKLITKSFVETIETIITRFEERNIIAKAAKRAQEIDFLYQKAGYDTERMHLPYIGDDITLANSHEKIAEAFKERVLQMRDLQLSIKIQLALRENKSKQDIRKMIEESGHDTTRPLTFLPEESFPAALYKVDQNLSDRMNKFLQDNPEKTFKDFYQDNNLSQEDYEAIDRANESLFLPPITVDEYLEQKMPKQELENVQTSSIKSKEKANQINH